MHCALFVTFPMASTSAIFAFRLSLEVFELLPAVFY